jgi:ribokinase
MVIVFGSINLDLLCRVACFPVPGETVSGSSFTTFPGGKGANQALAAARAGASVQLFGAVGRDAFASVATALLVSGGVDIQSVAKVDGPTGCATIVVDEHGENCIVVVAGANAMADPGTVPDAALTTQTVLVLQQEVDGAANTALIARARRAGARIILNAAPAHPVSLELLQAIDMLVVNESEASALATAFDWAATPHSFAASATAAAPRLSVILTLGAGGALWIKGSRTLRVQAPHVRVVDTTGAGDAFVGTLAAAIDGGAPPAVALRRAVVAGSLACTAHGAQPALPDRAAVDVLLPTVTAGEE